MKIGTMLRINLVADTLGMAFYHLLKQPPHTAQH